MSSAPSRKPRQSFAAQSEAGELQSVLHQKISPLDFALDFNPNRTIVRISRPVYRGAYRDRHETRGGVRWRHTGRKDGRPREPRPKPQGPDAPAARHGDRAANAGAGPYCAACGQDPIAVGKCWIPRPERERRLKSQPTGGSAEQATNTAHGTPGHRSGLAALPGFRQASVSRGAGVHGSFRAWRSPRPRPSRGAT